jgi:branched-chain amino acid transport system permease protein
MKELDSNANKAERKAMNSSSVVPAKIHFKSGVSFSNWHTSRNLLIGIIVFLYLVIIPLVFHDKNYILGVVSTISVLSLISLGVWITFSIGRINIGQGAFALIGGYTTAILSTRYGVSFWLCLPLSGLMAAFIGFIIGWPILRLKGVYFAMITLSITEATRLAFLNGGKLTGAAWGILEIPRPDDLYLFSLKVIPAFKGSDPISFYYLAAGLLIFGFVVVWRLSTCKIGAVFHSMRQDEELATSIGISVAKYRVIAYAVCCFLGGLGGSYFAVYQQNVFPATFQINDSIFFMLYCFLGGLDYVFGPIVGAILLSVSFEALHAVQQYQPLIYGVLMIALMLWLPDGILSLGSRRRHAKSDLEESGTGEQNHNLSNPKDITE